MVKFIYHNVRGLNTPQKCNLALKEASRLCVDVLMLQEAHFATQNPPNVFLTKTIHIALIHTPPQKQKEYQY